MSEPKTEFSFVFVGLCVWRLCLVFVHSSTTLPLIRRRSLFNLSDHGRNLTAFEVAIGPIPTISNRVRLPLRMFAATMGKIDSGHYPILLYSHTVTHNQFLAPRIQHRQHNQTPEGVVKCVCTISTVNYAWALENIFVLAFVHSCLPTILGADKNGSAWVFQYSRSNL
jgi:hypothetical protein